MSAAGSRSRCSRSCPRPDLEDDFPVSPILAPRAIPQLWQLDLRATILRNHLTLRFEEGHSYLRRLLVSLLFAIHQLGNGPKSGFLLPPDAAFDRVGWCEIWSSFDP
jgi:hypothetical protein